MNGERRESEALGKEGEKTQKGQGKEKLHDAESKEKFEKKEMVRERGETEGKKGIEKKETKKEAQEKQKSEEPFDPWAVLLHPHLAEKSMTIVELQNKLTFIVHPKATKRAVAEAVEKGFQVKVKQVNIEMTQKGVKKAYVTLSPKHSAADIATRLGMI